MKIAAHPTFASRCYTEYIYCLLSYLSNIIYSDLWQRLLRVTELLGNGDLVELELSWIEDHEIITENFPQVH